MMADQELRKLKYKRGAVKGKLTAFQNFLERFQAEPQLSELQIAELQLRYDKIVPIFDEFDALQTDIEMLSESETVRDAGIEEERKLFEDAYYASMSSAHVIIHKHTRRNTGDNASEPSSQRPRTDRFVAPRAAFEDLRRRSHVLSPRPRPNAIWHSKYMSQKKYASHIDKAWGLERPTQPSAEQAWPCVPRRRPHLSSADNVLDLPAYSSAVFPELLDWSRDNILVAALGTKYYKWSWRSQSPISKGFTLFNTACCRFDPTGEKLALGTDMQRVEIHNSWSKRVAGGWCRCSGLSHQFCHVTALDWSPTGHSFVIGCSRGTVTSFDRDAELISSRPATVNTIFLVRVSPDARYVAVAAVNSSQVMVMLWPSLYDSRSVYSDWIVKTIAWHPWRSALLGIGGVADFKSWIALWDAPRAALRIISRVSNSDFTLDNMLFSHRTGELVMSLWNTENQPYPKGSAQLVVMSGPETVVDEWGEGRQTMDRVRTMVFSPDGTKLATATADEDLVIWNFLPPDTEPSDKTKRRRFSAIPSFLDQSVQGFSVR